LKRVDFNKDWDFNWGEPPKIPMIPVQKKKVDLPYDFMIGTDVSKDSVSGPAMGYYKGGTGSYTKYYEVSEEDKDKVHILSFDGCFGITKVVVNGHVVCRHNYGYTPFDADITAYIKKGPNRITVTASNANEPNSRWYSGAGLYRKVYVLKGEKLHIPNDGLYTYTKELAGDEILQVVETTIENETDKDRKVKVRVNLIDKATGKTIVAKEDEILVAADACEVFETEIEVANAKLWNVDSPNLYICKVDISDDEFSDRDETQFGFRVISVDAENGLRINGKSVKLKGGCIHHDNGIVGAAAFRDSEYRKVMLHKKAGFNALRFAHNPVSRDMLNACDEIGMLCIDEAFDVWNMEKNYFDFSNYFANKWENELSSMMLRDRNHPCIFMWSIGNEIVEQGGLSDGYTTSSELASFAHEMDSSRPVGGALCSFFHGLNDEDHDKYWKSVLANADKLRKNGMVNLDCEFGQSVWDPYTTPFVKDWDIVGYNYLSYQYETSHEKHPDRVICCTESKPRELASYWDYVERLPYLIGDFEWTSMDYIGEAGIGNSFYVEPDEVTTMSQKMFYASYPARTAEAGNFDICGFEKPQIGYKKAVWGSDETYIVSYDPSVHDKVELIGRYGWGRCEHGWSWPCEEGSAIKLEVYSKASEVEVLVNGKSLGRKAAGKDNDFRAIYETAFEKGEVIAVSYDESGNEISRDFVKTAGEPVKTVIRKDKTLETLRESGIIPVDDETIDYLVIEVVDKDGNLVPYAEMDITAEELGLTNLIALGTGRATTEENYTKGAIKTYRGRALAVVKS